MPVHQGDVKVSTMPISGSAYRRFPLATTHGYRSASLDRVNKPVSSSYNKDNSYSTTYCSSYGTTPSSYTSSRPPRPSAAFESSSSTMKNIDLRKFNSNRATFDLTSNRFSSRRNKDVVAAENYPSPVLTKYRDLGDSSGLLSEPTIRSRRAGSPGANSNHSSTSSSSYDENFNHRVSRDIDSNLNKDKKSIRPWNTSDSSSSDYSPSPQRTRKSSHLHEDSGYSSRSSRESLDQCKPAGLMNVGNTCFMNSVLQCLGHIQPLVDYCVRDNHKSSINLSTSSMNGALIKAFVNLIQCMWKSGDSSVSPHAFKQQIQKFAPRFMGYNQQDAQEFLRYLLQGLHEDINRVTHKPSSFLGDIDDDLSDNQKATESWKRYLRIDDSSIVDTFVGQLRSSLQCTFCNYDSVTFDPFWDLSLPIPKTSSVSLLDCLAAFTKAEVLDGEEKPTCSKCKTRRKCIKSLSIHKFPKILALHLKRFSPNERYRTKLTTLVEFPLNNLDLSQSASSSSLKRGAVYNLVAVSNHSGGTNSGHYTAVCRHPYTGEWHEFNDERVVMLGNRDIVTSGAYVLFYELSSQISRL